MIRLASLLLGLLLTPAPALADYVLLDVMDIGQGDAILLRGAGKTLLIDAGPNDDVVSQLRFLGVRTIDLAIASHAHSDHIGGMEAVVRTFDVRRYMDNHVAHTTKTFLALASALRETGTTYVAPTIGMEIKLSAELKLKVLAPPSLPFTDTRSDHNSNSVVLLITHGDIEMLLTGDAEEPTEEWLIHQGLPTDLEVLKVAHHGSNHSTTTEFLEATTPQIALISCGRNNRFDHPGEETLKRLQAAGSLVYRTDLSNHLRVISDGTEVDVFEGALNRLGAKWPLEILASREEP